MVGMIRKLINVLVLGTLWLGAALGTVAAAGLADDLARVHLEAMGGREAQAALHSLNATGVTRINGQDLPFVLYAARPRSLRIETLGETGMLVRGFDGVHAPWQRRTLFGPPDRLAPGTAEDFVAEAEFDNLLYDAEPRGIVLEDAGAAEVDGRRCLRVLATVRLTEAYTLYLDETTMLVVRRDQRKRQRGKTVVVETYYSDYRPVAGVMMPFLIRQQIAGRVLTETQVKEITPNPAIPMRFFSPPTAEWPRW